MIKYPIHRVELNLTELCNRTCFFCPRALDYPNLNLHMTKEVAEQVCIQTEEYTNYITISGRGEPLLCKNLYEILETLVFYNKHIAMNTNGDFLDKHIDELDRILDLKKPRPKYKIGKEDKKWPKVPITVACYDGVEQKEEREKIYKDYSNNLRFVARTETMDSMYKGQMTNRAGALPWTQTKWLERPCYFLYFKTYINWNGDVNLCCHDWKIIRNFGNILDKPFKEIWEEGLLNEYRTGLTKYGGREQFPECIECDNNQEWSYQKKFYQQYINKEVKKSCYTGLND